MRWLIWTLSLIGLAVGVALVARFSVGNVAIFWPPYRVDLSVKLAIAIIVGSFVLLHLALLGLRKVSGMAADVRRYKESRVRDRAHTALSDALMAGFEGRFGRVERLAREAQALPETHTLAALLGARAAHRMREYSRRDEWLAQVNDPQAQNAKLITQAELLVEEQRPSDALVAIGQAQRSGVRHIHVMRTALRAHEQNGDWADVIRLTRTLDKRGVLHEAISQQYRINAYRRLASAADGPALNKLWLEVRSQVDIRARLAGGFAQRFEEVGNFNAARQIYKDEIDQSFNAAFVRRYIALEGQALAEKLSVVELWQKQYGNDPDLLLAIGDLCRKEKLWGKAQLFLEQAVAQKPTAAAHFSLGQMFDSLNNPDQANTHFRAAAALGAVPTPANSANTKMSC
jgi:HemY protein